MLNFIFSVNLILLSLDHFISGVLGVFFPKTGVEFYKRIFGADMELNPGHILILKPWGALGMFAAFAAIFAIIEPRRYIGVLVSLLALLLIRIWIRLRNKNTAETAYKISNNRNYFHVGLISLCAIIIAFQIYYITR